MKAIKTKKYFDGGPLGRPMTKSEMYAAAEKAYSPLAKAAAAKNAKFAGKTIAGDTTDPAEIAELEARKNYQSVYRDYVKSQGAPTGSDVEESARRAGILKVGGNIEGEKPIGEGKYTTEEYRNLSRRREKARNRISTGSPLLRAFRRGQAKRLTRKMSDTQRYTDTNPRG